MSLMFLTAGESHGRALVVILSGIPAGLPIKKEFLDMELKRRQTGYGRGGRMAIEKDEAEIISGVRGGMTIGSPVCLMIKNKDWENWQEVMDPYSPVESAMDKKKVLVPRPGHADLAGGLKYDRKDLREILERASARETAARVAAGAVAKSLLFEIGVKIVSYVTEIGGVKAACGNGSALEKARAAEASDLRCPDKRAEKLMKKKIDTAKSNGDTLGGVFEVVAMGLPAGLGSYEQWDSRLDGRLAKAIMSIPGIKAMEIGIGFQAASLFGSEVHDEIYYKKPEPGEKASGRSGGFFRKTNAAGGLEGGITNGEEIVLRAYMKPISTLMKPKMSVDVVSKTGGEAAVERSDICAVPSASVVGEAVSAIELAVALQEKTGGDSVGEMRENYQNYLERINRY